MKAINNHTVRHNQLKSAFRKAVRFGVAPWPCHTLEPLEPRVLLTSLSALASFNTSATNSTGSYPQGGLVADSAGDLFGTTAFGGSNGVGTVFEIPAVAGVPQANDIETIGYFDGSGDGNEPWGNLAIDGDALYGISHGPGKGTIFECDIPASPPATVPFVDPLASFNDISGNGPDTYEDAGGVTLFDNTLYGTTGSGGGEGLGTVFMLPLDTDSISMLYQFGSDNSADSGDSTAVTTNGTSGDQSNGSLVAGTDSSGTVHLYGTTQTIDDGNSGVTSIFDLALPSATAHTETATMTFTQFGTSANPGQIGPYGVADLTAVFVSGTTMVQAIYGTTFSNVNAGDTDFGTLFEYVPTDSATGGTGTLTTLATFAGSGVYGPEGGVVVADGGVYGLTPHETGSANGTVYQYDDSPGSTDFGSITMAGTFTGDTDTASGDVNGIYGTLIQVNGEIYGTANQGGAFDQGTVFELSLSSPAAISVTPADGTTLTSGDTVTVSNTAGDSADSAALSDISVTQDVNGNGTFGQTGLSTTPIAGGDSQTGTVDFTASNSSVALLNGVTATGTLAFNAAGTTIDAGSGQQAYSYPLATTVTGNTGDGTANIGAGGSYGTSTAPLNITRGTGDNTGVKLLGGTATSATTVGVAFTDGGSDALSDVATISGMGTDLHVIEMSYKPTLVPSGSPANSVMLGWLNTSATTPFYQAAPYGNSDGGATKQEVLGAYTSADFTLGDYGLDTVNDEVWAVVNSTGTYEAVSRLPGDVNGDGTVDTRDFDIWFRDLGQSTNLYSKGDVNGDGVVDTRDFDIWFAHLGQSNGTSGGGPATDTLDLSLQYVGSLPVATANADTKANIINGTGFTALDLTQAANETSGTIDFFDVYMQFTPGTSTPDDTFRSISITPTLQGASVVSTSRVANTAWFAYDPSDTNSDDPLYSSNSAQFSAPYFAPILVQQTNAPDSSLSLPGQSGSAEYVAGGTKLGRFGVVDTGSSGTATITISETAGNDFSVFQNNSTGTGTALTESAGVTSGGYDIIPTGSDSGGMSIGRVNAASISVVFNLSAQAGSAIAAKGGGQTYAITAGIAAADTAAGTPMANALTSELTPAAQQETAALTSGVPDDDADSGQIAGGILTTANDGSAIQSDLAP